MSISVNLFQLIGVAIIS